VTFAAHLKEDFDAINGFRGRHQKVETIDDLASEEMASPEACLSPAVCYHVYHLYESQTLSRRKCFRFESSNIFDLRRLWDFTMSEVVFLGARDPAGLINT
jgi:hypothetical protein